MKVIFLDIDGVIKEDRGGAPFLDESLDLLKDVVDKTGAKIVMSSTWKVKYRAFVDNGYKTDIEDISRLYSALTAHGLSISGYTPLYRIEKTVRRPTEIKDYLCNNEDVESFCILDDRDEFEWDELTDRLVLTFLGTDDEGRKIAHFTEAHAKKAIEILNY